MRELLKSIKWNTILMAALTVIMGIALIINPDFATRTICLLVGWVLLISGVASVIMYLRGYRRVFGVGELILGILELALGLFIVINPDSVVKFLSILFAAILVVHGINDVREARNAKKYGDEHWMVSMGLGVLSLLLGILIFWSPFSSASFMMVVVGLALIFDGVTDIIIILRLGKYAKQFGSSQEGEDFEKDIIDMDDEN